MPEGYDRPQAIRFGSYEADLAAGELRKNGVLVRLESQPFQVLAMLLARPGEVVTREEIQQALWAGDTFVDFGNGLNTAIRKIRRALDDSATEPKFVETLPKRGYRFVGAVEASSGVAPMRRFVAAWLIAASAAAAAALYAYWPATSPERLTFAERMLTYGPGREGRPAFSPDGARIAFDWDGGSGAPRDIYVQYVSSGSSAPVAITDDPREEINAAWSPDGLSIAFARILELRPPPLASDWELVVVAPDGSGERVLGTFSSRGNQIRLAWAPDGKHIAYSGRIDAPAGLNQICMLSVETGETWPLTTPSGTVGDGAQLFSPDGRAIVYRSARVPELLLLPLDEDMRSAGEPAMLAERFWPVSPAGWSVDGETLYFGGRAPTGEYGLWSVARSDASAPRLFRAGVQAAALWSDDSGRMRIVHQRQIQESAIVRIDLLDEPAGQFESILDASGLDFNPRYSPDGSRIAFMSDRTGNFGVWTSRADGSDPELVVEFPGFAGYSTPKWSPDGGRIAVDAIHETTARDVYVIDVAARRVAKRLTEGAGRWPAWSHDGSHIFCTPGGTSAIWSVDVETGEKQTVLDGYGSFELEASPDGKRLYFLHANNLMRIRLKEGSAHGGAPETIAKDVAAFALSERALVVLDRSGDLYSIDEQSRVATRLADSGMQSIPGGAEARVGIDVSPDGRWLLATVHEAPRYDLMLLESVE